MSETRRTAAARDDVSVPGAKRRLARSRGAGTGLVVLLLGVWGALIPFVGPYFNFSYTPDKAWHWDAARGWLEVLPGAAAFLGGLLLLVSASRATAVFGAWLAILAGAWFVVGPQLAQLMHIGSPGTPAGTHRSVMALESLFLFYALGALIIFFAATAFGRLSVVSRRDVAAAERRHDSALAEREAAERDAADRDGARRREASRTDVAPAQAGTEPRHVDTAGEHAAQVPPAGSHVYDQDAPQQTRAYDPNVGPAQGGTEPPVR